MEQRKHSMYPLIPLCVAALLADPEGLSPLDKKPEKPIYRDFPEVTAKPLPSPWTITDASPNEEE